MPPLVLALWPLLLTILQSLVSYLLGRGVFESLLLAGIRRYCKRWPNATVIELAIAWADSVGKRHLLGDLQVPPDHVPLVPSRNRAKAGYTTSAFVALIAIVGVSGIIGYSFGVWRAQPVRVPIIAKPAQALPGGGLRLETTTDPDAKPAQPVAKGSKVAATGQIKVTPKPKPTPKVANADSGVAASAGPAAPVCSCEDITIDYTLTTDKDGQPGMQASADGAEVTGGHHNPMQGVLKPYELPWAIGVSYGLSGESGGWGVAVDRDWSAIRGSVDLFQDGDRIGGRIGGLLRF